MEIFDLTAKHLLGEELADAEKLRLQRYNAKYELVRYIYKEKMEHIEKTHKNKKVLVDFHFTPGGGFEEMPIYDIVNALMKVYEKTESGEYKPIDVGDISWA